MAYANALNLLKNPTGNKALSSDATGLILEESQTTKTELEYLVGVTSPIQDQLDDTSITREGNTFNNANELVKLDGLGKIPASSIPSVIQADKGYFGILQSDSALSSIFAVGRYVSGSPDKIFEISDTAVVQFFKPITGNVIGNVTGSAGSAVTVGGKTAAQVSQSVDDTLAATSSNIASTIAKRDVNGNSSFSTPTSALHAATKAYADRGFQEIVNTNTFTPSAPFISGKFYIVNPTLLGNVNFTLPAASSVDAGFVIPVKSNALGATNILPGGSDTIEYAVTVQSGNSAAVVSDGVSKWVVMWNTGITGVVSVINGVSTFGANVVSNSNLAQVPANTVKANLTGLTANPSDVTISALKAVLGLGTFLANQMVFTDGGGIATTNINYTVNGSGNLTISGTLGANKGIFSGLKGVSVNGATPSLSAGNNAELGETTTAGNFAANAAVGDTVLRTVAGQTLRLGAGSGVSVLDITASLANLNFPITLAQTQGGSAVTGSVKSNFEYFEEGTFTTATTGAIVFASFTIKFLRLNQKIFMFLQDFSQNAVASSTIVTSAAIPSRFIPPVTKHCIVEGQRGANRRAIGIQISNTGIVTIFGDETGGNFNNGQIAAYFGESAIYSLN